MNRIDRLLGTILMLEGRRSVTAEQIAAHFEISVRTVYRDLSALSEIGVPIAAEAGVGYSLLKGYYLPPVMFSESEASASFLGGELVKGLTDSSVAGPIGSALLKIQAVLPPQQREQAERILRHMAVIGPPRRSDQPDRRVLLPIQRAVALCRVLHLVYLARGQAPPKPRDVEPLGVVFYGGAWYLIAWCRVRAHFRNFRPDRIQHLAVRDATFEPRAGFSLLRHLEESVRREKTVPARIRFTAKAAERARSECFAGLVEERLVGGRVEMDLLTFSLDWLGRWVLSFGDEAEAVAPEHLRELVRSKAEVVAQLYRRRGVTRKAS
jgi:predicted DNA-binding transcriptional regulator YafY